MHRLIIIFFISSLLPLCPLAAQDANPLLEMVGKESNDYFDTYETLCDSLFAGDSLSRVSLVKLFTEAAAADPSGEWDFDRRRIEGHVRFFESREGGYTPSADYTADDFTADLLQIAGQAGKKGLRTIRRRALFNAAAVCRIFAHDYERAFRYYLEVAAELETVPVEEFPWKFYLYQEIADFYFSFREYKDAMIFYRKIAESPDMTPKYKRQLYSALNGLGLCYRYDEQYSRSDSCFQRILDFTATSEEDKYVWEGIALACIGTNHYLRGDTDKALAWMLPALQKMKRPNDDLFSSNLAASIANIYLLRNDLPNGKKYLETALAYHRRSRLPQKNSRLLEVETLYHTLRGDRSEAAACLDSTLRAKEREQEAYSGLVLRRVEQQLRTADQRMHAQELSTEKLRTTSYKRTAFWVSCALAVILILLILLAIYYRRTRHAYHELVLRSQRWAKVETAEERPCDVSPEADDCTPTDDCTPADVCTPADDHAPASKTLPDSADRTIMEKIEQLMEEKMLFTNADLSLDMLAAELGLHRRHVSAAINACTSKNFFAYVNEYRVKEAIRLMSDADNQIRTIDAIAFDSGFNDRKTFHRIFKQFTGLTPGAFRDSL